MSKFSQVSALLFLVFGSAACGDSSPSQSENPNLGMQPAPAGTASTAVAGTAPLAAAGRGGAGGAGIAGSTSAATAGAAGAAVGSAQVGTAGSSGATEGGAGMTAFAGAGGEAMTTAGTGGMRAAAGSGGAAGGGTGGSGQQPSGDCSTPPAEGELVGWATVSGDTKGGGGAAPTMITNSAALQAAVSGNAPATLWIKGSLDGDLNIGSNKTLVGLCDARLHGHIEMSGSTNVILRNLTIVGYAVGNCALDPTYNPAVGCSSGQDAITVQKNANHIWIDHCDISDGTDGNLDITNGSNYITVSWTKFHYTSRSDNTGNDSTGSAGHRYSNLIGGTDHPSKYDDAHALNVTWHHNWWADNVVERQPRVRFGKNHLFNNLWTSKQTNYCVRAGKQGQLLVEASVFDGVHDPQQFNNSSDQSSASITVKDNVYNNTSGKRATGGGGPAFTQPPYAYTPDPTQNLEQMIRDQAGPR